MMTMMMTPHQAAAASQLLEQQHLAAQTQDQLKQKARLAEATLRQQTLLMKILSLSNSV
jgi:hypothetical protein